ncbi:hypothetical protein GOBAR_AA00528 [Gossypium barbadense]|uniref:Uncharacterized protein n=1 Tax=Gossypium barbadense TaxID=3634 RepID=A0A2P5YWQ8_GOSBA|nr:hypothetical protein GOBAR_AA00528 [Gossypium barbadense]
MRGSHGKHTVMNTGVPEAVWELAQTTKTFNKSEYNTNDIMTNTHGKKATIPASKKQKGLGATSSVWALLATAPWDRFFDIIEATYLELTLELCSTFQLQTVMAKYDDLDTIQFRLGRLVQQLSILEFGVALGLYTEDFMEADNFPHLHRHIHYAPSSCWASLMPATGVYDPSCSKASALSPTLLYLHALLAHTLTRQ